MYHHFYTLAKVDLKMWMIIQKTVQILYLKVVQKIAPNSGQKRGSFVRNPENLNMKTSPND